MNIGTGLGGVEGVVGYEGDDVFEVVTGLDVDGSFTGLVVGDGVVPAASGLDVGVVLVVATSGFDVGFDIDGLLVGLVVVVVVVVGDVVGISSPPVRSTGANSFPGQHHQQTEPTISSPYLW